MSAFTARKKLDSSFILFSRRFPRVVLLLVVIPVALVALDAFRRLTQVVSSTSVFIFLYAVAVLAGVALFVIRAPSMLRERKDERVASKQQIYIMGVMFAIAAALWALWNSGVGLPPLFVLFLSFAAALIAVQILSFTGRRASLGILAQIITVGALLRAAPYYLNPYVYASDTYFHFNLIQSTVSSGYFVGRGPYTFYPAYHIFNAMGLQIGGIPTTSFAVLNLTAIVLSLLIFYAVGRRLISERAGLLGALLVVIGNFYFPSASYQPTFLGIITLMTATLVLVLRYSGANRGIWIAFWIAGITTLLIHPIDFLVLVLIVVGAFLAVIGNRKAPAASSVPVWSTAVVFVAYILYISFFFFRDIIQRIFETAGVALTPNVAVETSPLAIYTVELVYAYLGIAAKALFLVPGVLILLARRKFEHNWPALATSIVIAVPFIGLLGGRVASLQLTRFLLYLDILIVFPIAFGLIRLLAGAPAKRRKILLGGLIFALASLSLTSYLTVDTEGFMTTAVPTQPGLIDQAGLSAHGFLVKIPAGGSLTIDWGSGQYLAADQGRGPYQLPLVEVSYFNPNQEFNGFLGLSLVTSERGGFTSQGLQKLYASSWISQAETVARYGRVFDSGTYLVFFNP